jgi:hypothetical protein
MCKYCKVMQAIQREAQRVQDQPRLSFSVGQHCLAMLYAVDAMCSMAKKGQKALPDKMRVKLRKHFSAVLPELVHLLATPCNCDKV